MTEPKKITIIEGPPPTFEFAHETWLYGLTEGPSPYRIARCQVRTFKDGLTHMAPIVAARWMEREEGDVLLLWVRLEESEVEIELDFEFDDGEDDDDEDGPFWEPPESWG